MKTVFLAWQNPGPDRAWYPIVRLDRLDDFPDPPHFCFRYLKGAQQAQEKAGMEPLENFPTFSRVYRAANPFALFKNRIMNAKRPDFADYLKAMGLDPQNPDPMEILAISNGKRETDNFEVFPKIEPDAQHHFCCRFFLHGWRHVHQAAQERIPKLQNGEELQVAIERGNPATDLAIQLQTEDYLMLGWTPRYLVDDLVPVITRKDESLKARIVQVNRDAPAFSRVLVELAGPWPQDYKPMSQGDFELLVKHKKC